MEYLLGIDIGTSGTKTVLFDRDANPITAKTFEYPLYQEQNGWAEQEPEDWWNAVVQGVQAVLQASGVDVADIKGIGLSGQMHGLVMLDENGEVLRWQVSCQRGEGYIAAANVRMTEDEALAQYDAELYQLHAARGDSWGGGDAAGLDYYPVEKGAIEGNVMPDEVRALYLNGSAVQYADSYLRVAEGSGVNAFVVDIVDGTAVSYASPVRQQYSPSA